MDLSGARWRKSSHSGDNGGHCVELASETGVVAVRDSKDPEGGALLFERDAFRTFIRSITNT